MIPKRIMSIWLNEDLKVPDIVKKSLESQNIKGYESVLITLVNVDRSSKYVNDCIERKQWVRAADYLRIFYLNKLGGVYLDADTEILPGKNFDDFLDNGMFVFKEESGYLNNGFIGSEANHPFLDLVLRTMETNFRHDQNVFLPGMQFFSDLYYISDRKTLKMAIYPDIHLKDIAIHHGLKSWV